MLVTCRAVLTQATTASPLATGADTIVVGVFEGEEVAHDLPGGALSALLSSGEARASFERIAMTHAEGRRFLLVGLGARAAFDPERARVAAALAGARARELGTSALCWEVPHHVGEEIVEGLVLGTLLHAYRFERYRADPEADAGVQRLIVSAHHELGAVVTRATVLGQAQNRARDLANAPANDLTPAALATYAEQLGDRLDRLRVTVMDEARIRQAGMGAFAAVAQGSEQGARLIQLEYDGAAAQAPRLALVGKAVTFDTGGVSLKSAAKMHEMKFDMCGGAAVIEALAALAELQVPARVLGVVGATENHLGGGAVRPGDIVRALDGTTIEVNNTDAEGRLVLADCLCHAQREGCERIVDVATLTGGVVVALGSTYAGLMANDDSWAQQVEQCGASTGELVWRLPLHRDYDEMIKGRYAQLANVNERREATASIGAQFLARFVERVPWAHLDIAGTAFDVRRPYFDRGGTGFGVRLLVELARRV